MATESRRKLPPTLPPITCLSMLCFIRDVLWMLICAAPIFLITLVQKIVPKSQKDLKGKIVLVTGAGNNLGRELSIQLSKLGAIVICVDINQKWNEETAKQISSFKGSSKAYQCDVSIPEDVAALADKVLNDYGKVDIVINNAGIKYRKGVLEGRNDDIKKVFEVTRAFLPAMLKEGSGHIVFVSSGSGIHGLALENVYSASKFALLGMAYSLIEEFRSNKMYKNIKVSCVIPYFIQNDVESKYWRLRLPAFPKEEAIKLMIKGIRKEQKFFTIPGMTMGYTFGNVLRSLPDMLYHKIRDTFYTDIILPDESIVYKL